MLQGIQLDVNILLTVSESVSPHGASADLFRRRRTSYIIFYPYYENGLVKEPALD